MIQTWVSPTASFKSETAAMRNMLNRFCQDMLYSNVIDTHKMVLVLYLRYLILLGGRAKT